MGKKARRPKVKENQRKPKRRRGRTAGYREECQRRHTHDQEAPARGAAPAPWRSGDPGKAQDTGSCTLPRLDLAVGVGADAPGAGAAGAGAGAGAGSGTASSAFGNKDTPPNVM